MMNLRKTLLALAGAGALLTGCSTGQPSPGCYLQSDEIWFLQYTPTANSGACTAAQLAMRGEEAGVVKYRAPSSDTAQLVIRPFSAAALLTEAGSNGTFTSANAVGSLAIEPNADRFCEVGAVNPVSIQTNAGAYSYQFSNVRTYAGARALGTQMAATLNYTAPGTGGAACNITFDVKGMWPITECVPGSTDPAESCGAGSGVNQDVKWTCVSTADGDFCGQADAVPSYKDGIEEIDYADE